MAVGTALLNNVNGIYVVSETAMSVTSATSTFLTRELTL